MTKEEDEEIHAESLYHLKQPNRNPIKNSPLEKEESLLLIIHEPLLFYNLFDK